MTNMLPTLRDSLNQLRDNFDHAVDFFLPKRREGGSDVSPFFPSFFSPTRPAIDMDEDENEYRISAEMPGLDPGDFKVELLGNRLMIKGEKKSSREDRKGNTYYSECCYGSFVRDVSVPGEVDANKIEANYKNGILEIRLPKTEKAKAKKVEIKVN